MSGSRRRSGAALGLCAAQPEPASSGDLRLQAIGNGRLRLWMNGPRAPKAVNLYPAPTKRNRRQCAKRRQHQRQPCRKRNRRWLRSIGRDGVGQRVGVRAVQTQPQIATKAAVQKNGLHDRRGSVIRPEIHTARNLGSSPAPEKRRSAVAHRAACRIAVAKSRNPVKGQSHALLTRGQSQ